MRFALSASSPTKHQILNDTFGFEAFRAGQEVIIDSLLAGRHVLAVMPTGAGKSLCFQVPALVLDGLTLVVSPLVALMQDQVAALRLAGIATDTINSAQDADTNAAVWARVRAGETKLLYVSPERLMTEWMLDALRQCKVSLIAIDEAHCLSQWGPAFRPDYQALTHLTKIFPQVPIVALTATADEQTRADIAAQLFDNDADIFVHGFDRPNIQLAAEVKQNWKGQLLSFLKRHDGESGIVYCLSRKKTEAMATLLNEHGIHALPYHAGMEAGERAHHQNTFMSEQKVVTVATIAFGMGIDKADVRFVAHVDLPASMEAYYQEIGRAGRDGLAAQAYMLYGPGDIRMRRQFIEEEDSDEARKAREHKRLDALITYCEAPCCRRQTLLSYFGEEIEPCGNCDACLDTAPLVDGSVDGQKILSAIYRTGQRYGAAHIVDVLRGKATDKVIAAGHDQLPTFAIGKMRKIKEWQSLIRQMISNGFLFQDVKAYNGLSITDKGRQLLRQEIPFHYRQDTMGRAETVSTKINSEAAELTPDQFDRLAGLKSLRLSLAQARGVPAYVIFPDKTLLDMTQRNPQTVEEFAEVGGVGQAKLRDFAEAFLEVLREG